MPVEAFKIQEIDATFWGGWEGIVLLQLVVTGQKAFDGRHGDRAWRGGT